MIYLESQHCETVCFKNKPNCRLAAFVIEKKTDILIRNKQINLI